MNTKQSEALSKRIAEARDVYEIDIYRDDLVRVALDERGDAHYFYADGDHVFTGLITIYGYGFTYIGDVSLIHSDNDALDCECKVCTAVTPND